VTKASFAPALVLVVFALAILPMVAMVALLFLLNSADPGTAVLGAMDGRGMLIPPS
jgi:hypothetical protein